MADFDKTRYTFNVHRRQYTYIVADPDSLIIQPNCAENVIFVEYTTNTLAINLLKQISI